MNFDTFLDACPHTRRTWEKVAPDRYGRTILFTCLLCGKESWGIDGIPRVERVKRQIDRQREAENQAIIEK